MDTQLRETLKNKKRVIVKIGSSSLLHEETGNLNLLKLERLVRELCDIKNQGMDVCLVSSGAIAVGRQSMGLKERPKKIAVKQACAAVGQARLMMTYQKLFSEYHQNAGQVLMTKNTMIDNVSRKNAQNTFEELFSPQDQFHHYNNYFGFLIVTRSYIFGYLHISNPFLCSYLKFSFDFAQEVHW